MDARALAAPDEGGTNHSHHGDQRRDEGHLPPQAAFRGVGLVGIEGRHPLVAPNASNSGAAERDARAAVQERTVQRSEAHPHLVPIGEQVGSTPRLAPGATEI